MSVKDLIRPPSSYSPGGDEVVDYLAGEKVWDQRDGTVRSQNYNLRLLLILSTVANMILCGGIWYQSSKSMLIPYVVEKSIDGSAQAVTVAKEAVYEPKEAEIKYFIEHFVLDSRTLPLDPVVAKNQWKNAFALLRSGARNKMTEEFRKDNMQNRIGTETTQISVKAVLQQSPDTYQVRWQEEVYGVDGSLKDKYTMSGSFSVEFSVPKTEQELRITPLGLYIKNFSWSREI